jgi:adenosylcobinamide-GDP ribazoletransferase
MRWIKAVVLAFSTYTRIPMPQVKWDDDAMKLAIAFLPLVGALIGAVVWGWQLLCGVLGFSPVLFAAIAAALPIIITGGIHMDGYCDTSDALSSWQDRERRLEILKDPHVGAFAVIRSGVYLLIYFALLYEIFLNGYGASIGFIFVISRCFAAWNAMTMPNVRQDGMLAAFIIEADRKKAGVILALLTLIGIAGWVWAFFPRNIFGLLLCLPVTFWYRKTAVKRFGGATGDTTGFYLQITELALLAGTVLGGAVWSWQ